MEKTPEQLEQELAEIEKAIENKLNEPTKSEEIEIDESQKEEEIKIFREAVRDLEGARDSRVKAWRKDAYERFVALVLKAQPINEQGILTEEDMKKIFQEEGQNAT